MSKNIKTRLLSKVKIDASNCWVWTGSKFRKKNGDYARIGIGGKHKRAHRISYEEFVGMIPVGLELDHICCNTLCINPDHLEPVTHSENMKRRKDLGLPTCKYGHLYTKETTYINPRGRRECQVCRDLRNKIWYRKKHELMKI